MSQVTSDSIDGLHYSGNGDSRPSSRALVVREHESQALSPYLIPGGMSPYGAEPVSGGLNLTQLLHAVRRRWLLALFAGLLIGLPLAALVWLITPANYEVIAWLKVGDDPAALLENRGFYHRDPVGYEQYRKTQAALIKSPDVLRAALSDTAVVNLPLIHNQQEPEEFLKEEISVAFPLESEVLQIKMRGRDKGQLVKIVNAVMESYLKNVVDRERLQTNMQFDLIDKQVKENLAFIAEKQEQLRNLMERIGHQDYEGARAKLQHLMTQANSKLHEKSAAEEKLRQLNVKIAITKSRNDPNSGPPEHLVEAAISRDPSIASLNEQISAYQNAIFEQQALVKHADRDPKIKQWQDRIAGLRERLDQMKADLRPTIEKYVKTQMEQDNAVGAEPRSLEEMQKMKEELETQIKSLTDEYVQFKTASEEASQQSSGVEILFDEIKRKREITRELDEKLERLRLLIKMPPRVTILQNASDPEAPNPMLRYFLAIFSCIVGFAVGAGGVIMVEYQARRVNNTADLSLNAGLRVLGTVPNLAKLANSKGLNGSAALQGILAESVDSIRTMLLTRDDPPHAIIITSAGDSEGKTTVASHLAASLARSGRRTLLVDGDIRSPSIHAMFGAAPEPGVCEVLRGEADFEGVLQPTPVDGLMLVAAGQCDYQCIAALAKDRFKEFIEKARVQFEYVIIDAAPVLTYSDMLLMGAHVDAAVLSVRRDVSQMHRVYEARQRMESVGIRVLGAVVNGLSENSRRPAYALPTG